MDVDGRPRGRPETEDGWLMAHIDQTSRRIVSAVAGFALAMTLMQVARARQRQRTGTTT